MLTSLSIRLATASVVLTLLIRAQDTTSPAGKPTEHVLGTISSVDSAAQSVTVKEDKTNGEHVILLGATKTLLKVPPGAKDLKTATRITAAELAVGDRVDVRGNKAADAPDKIAARSLVLMSGRELAVVHQAQAAEWQNASSGVVTSTDPAALKIGFNERTAEGPKPVTIVVTPGTEFTRYAPKSPATPSASQLSEIHPGDQLRVIGDAEADGSTISAKRVYTGSFRTLNGTIASLAPDGSEMVIKNLATKQPVTLQLNASSQIQKLSPEMAQMMAHRLNGGGSRPSASAGGAGTSQGSRPSEDGNPAPHGAPASVAAPNGAPGAGASAHGPRNGDISRLIERLPKVGVSDLKQGDAVVVTGAVEGADSSHLVATHVIAGVEPLLQATPSSRQHGGEALGGDWGLGEMSAPQ